MDKSISNEQCNICNKNLKTKKLLQNHIIQVHDVKKDKTSKNDICNKVLKRQSLKLQKNTVHQKGKPNNCEFCDKSFSRAGYLKEHIHTTHEGHKEQMY